MSFRDTTFCASDCTNQECDRFYGDKERAAADKWWGGPGAPVAYANFKPDCKIYLAPRKDQP